MQGQLRDNPLPLAAAVTIALLDRDSVFWFNGDHVCVETARGTQRFEVDLGVVTNKRKLECRPGPFVRVENKGISILGTLLRYRKAYRKRTEALPYTPPPVESPYGVAPRVQILASTLARLGATDANIHGLINKDTYEPKSLAEAVSLDHTVGQLNEKMLVAHDTEVEKALRAEAAAKYQAWLRKQK